MREITKEKGRELIDRWCSGDKDLTLAERVYCLEHFVAKLLTEPE